MQIRGKNSFVKANYTDVYLATEQNFFIFKIVMQNHLFSQRIT